LRLLLNGIIKILTPNPAQPVGVKRKSRFIGEPKKKLITKASRRCGKNTEKDKLNFVLFRRKQMFS
jgi:hypothetical protein